MLICLELLNTDAKDKKTLGKFTKSFLKLIHHYLWGKILSQKIVNSKTKYLAHKINIKT